MMKVLLINPQEDWKSDRGFKVMTNRTYNDHLGIRYVASMLEKNGHHVDLIDAHFEMMTTEMVYEAVVKDRYDYYGISVVEPIIEDCIKLARYIKKINPACQLFIGGYSSTLLGWRILRDCPDIDGAVLGEGEITTSELLDKMSNRQDWRDVHGIMYLKDDEIFTTPQRELIQDLDSIPIPKRGPADKYNGKANILASRGCYGQCNFCSIAEYYRRMKGPKIRIRNPKAVVDEMEYLCRNFGVHHFDFVDDNFTVTCIKNIQWAETFVTEILNRDLNITWGIQARANDIDEELMRLLHKSGLRIVSTGIENDVPRAMKLLNTGTNKEIHRKAVEILRKTGMHWWVEMIILEPTATLDEIRENLDFLDEIRITENYRQNPVTFYPRLKLYHGTPMSTKLKGVADIYEDGYHLKYHFKDPKVEKLDDIINSWQEKTAETVNIYNTYLHYEASARGMVSLSLKAARLCRQYLNLDMKFLRSAIDFVEQNVEFSCEQKNALFALFENEIEKIYSELLSIKERIFN